MSASTYTCWVLGVDRERAKSFHPITLRRMRSALLAMHVIVPLWAITGFAISRNIFAQGLATSLACGAFSAGLIFCLEQIILQAPRGHISIVARCLFAVLSAAIATSMFDIISYDREIVSSLMEQKRQLMMRDHARELAVGKGEVDTKRNAWLKARQDAMCEGNGTCGSRQRNAGPLYRELLDHADKLYGEYLRAEAAGERLKERHQSKMNSVTETSVSSSAGVIARIEALHHYLDANNTAMIFFGVKFALVLLIELSVLIVKVSYGETIDDRLERSHALRAIHDAERLMLARLGA